MLDSKIKIFGNYIINRKYFLIKFNLALHRSYICNRINVFSMIEVKSTCFKKIMIIWMLSRFEFVALSQSYEIQNTKKYSLQEIVNLAKEQSLSYQKILAKKETKFWNWKYHLSNTKPQFSFNSNSPFYTRSYNLIQQNNGTYVSALQHNSFVSLGLSLSQNIALTGGQIYISSVATKFDNFSNKFTNYTGNPFYIGISQPLIAFNKFKWDLKIQPMIYEESEKQYFMDLEEISMNTTKIFFDLLTSQINVDIAKNNLKNAEELYLISKERFKFGNIYESELLQIELSVLNANQQINEAKINLDITKQNLKNFIGLNDSNLILSTPNLFPNLIINEDYAISQAINNRPEQVSYLIQKLEAISELEKAKKSRFSGTINATFGRTGAGNLIENIYDNSVDQQTASLIFQVPIIDWGRTKSKIQIAKANQQLIESTVNQNKLIFLQEISMEIKRIPILVDQIKLTLRTSEIAEKRFLSLKSRSLVGKISITDLNIAIAEKDIALKNYFESLRRFWISYYKIRMLTLYDFEKESILINQTKTKK